ncbi:MAG: AAA family ATPase [bacterium]|nr:AAA family ATPase [bacterium]
MSKDKSQLIKLDIKRYSAKSLKILEALKREVKGQDRSLLNIVDAFEIKNAGLRSPNRTICNEMLLGPSGVGKSETARAVALTTLGNREYLTKIDCHDYQASHEISRLFGAPPGYLGHGNSCILDQINIDSHALKAEMAKYPSISPLRVAEADLRAIEREIWKLIDERYEVPSTKMLVARIDWIDQRLQALNRQRREMNNRIHALITAHTGSDLKNLFSVIVFEEIEKAHPALWNALLAITGDAKITLANGDITRFDNSAIFLTSNVGSEAIAKVVSDKLGPGFHFERKKHADKGQLSYDAAKKAADATFPAEFMGRVNVSVYRHLSNETLFEIFDLEMLKFEENFLAKDYIQLKVSEELENLIIKESTDRQQSGARLLAHKISKYLLRYFARLKNRGELDKGDTIHVFLGADGEPEFYREPRLLDPIEKIMHLL